MTTESNESLVRRDARPAAVEGVRYCALTFTGVRNIPADALARLRAEVVAANAKLLDMAIPEGAAFGDLREKAVAMISPDFRFHLIPYFPQKAPVVRIEGPCGVFLVDLNGTPFHADGFATYDGDSAVPLRVRSVDLDEYCSFYEVGSVLALCGESLGTLDTVWTMMDGRVEGADDEIRDAGLIAESVASKRSGDSVRFKLLSAKRSSPEARNIAGLTLDEALSEAGLAA